MKLVILHGPPASGKLTIANELARVWGYPVMHNHLTVDLALTIYPEFGTPDFFNFVDSIRAISIGRACKNQLSGLIVTTCYTQADAKNVSEWTKIVQAQGGTVLPIYLDVPKDVLKKRVCEPSRTGTNKIQTIELLEEALAAQQFGRINSADTISVCSGNLTIQKSVNEILKTQPQH